MKIKFEDFKNEIEFQFVINYRRCDEEVVGFIDLSTSQNY